MSGIKLLIGILVALLCGVNAVTAADQATRPNVVFLAVDDMKDWVQCLGGYEGTVHTPNIDRLAARGMLFTNAHCPSPLCAPSRAAIMIGLPPSKTGLYANNHWWLPNAPSATTLPMHFRNNGYHAVGIGKIFHHTAGNQPPNQWDEFHGIRFRNDPWFRTDKSNYPWSASSPYPPGFPFSQVAGLGHENDWGALSVAAADFDDALSAEYAIKVLRRPHNQPFFLACGLFRPHLPWYVPQEFLDRYPLDEIALPEIKADDLQDVPAEGTKLAKQKGHDFNRIRKANKWREAVRAYLASISFADHQLGRVLDALDQSPYAKNTIVVLWSDHGWHLGEKQHWHKGTLWEEATRVPLIVAAPGYQPGKCARAVSLLDLYPTLVELAHLDSKNDLAGKSLVPQLKNPSAPRATPAVIEYLSGNAAVRDDRYRYIRYHDGGDELYDLEADPHEWHNQAANPDYADIKRKLAAWIPQQWAKPALDKKQFNFDPNNFTWTNKETGQVISGADR